MYETVMDPITRIVMHMVQEKWPRQFVKKKVSEYKINAGGDHVGVGIGIYIFKVIAIFSNMNEKPTKWASVAFLITFIDNYRINPHFFNTLFIYLSTKIPPYKCELWMNEFQYYFLYVY